MTEKSNNVLKHIKDDILLDWITDFLWHCWPEHGISHSETTIVISSIIEDYLKSCLLNSPHHFPNAEALVSTFDFVPHQTEQNDGDGGCL